MNKRIFVIIGSLAVLFFAWNVNALVLEEKDLSSLGFFPIIASPNTTHCQSFSFSPFEGYAEEGNDTVLTLNVEMIPQGDPDANVSVFVNDERFRVIHANDLLSNGNVHVMIPAEEQTNPSTKITVCGTESPESQKLTISNTTKIGIYQQARFDTRESFQTLLAGKEPVLGDEISVQVFVSNTGGESTSVSIDYRKYELDYVPLLKGETGFQGIILPGETKILTYTIKPLRAVSILLPPAVLKYTNIFGEEIIQESTRPFLLVEPPAFNVRGVFLVPQVRVNVNEPVTVQWVVQNDGIAPVEGINATFNVYPQGNISPSTSTVSLLSPAKAVSHPFTLTFSQPGIYTLGCTLTLPREPVLTTGCQSATIEVVQPNNSIALFFSLILLLIAMGVYAYIYVLPNRPAVKPSSPKHGRFHSK